MASLPMQNSKNFENLNEFIQSFLEEVHSNNISKICNDFWDKEDSACLTYPWKYFADNKISLNKIVSVTNELGFLVFNLNDNPSILL